MCLFVSLCQKYGGVVNVLFFMPPRSRSLLLHCKNIRAKLTERGAMLADTDWHIPQLYDGLVPQATIFNMASTMKTQKVKVSMSAKIEVTAAFSSP